MHKYLKKIFTSLLIIPMSLIFVSCNAHENSGIVVDGKENNYSYSKTTINLSNNSLWSNFGELFGLGDNWEGIIEDFCFEHQNKTIIPKQYTPFATYGETIYFNGGSRALSVNLFYVNIWR